MEQVIPLLGLNTRDRLMLNLKQLVAEAEHLLKSAQRAGNEQFNIARDKFEAQLQQAKEELSALESKTRQNARRTLRATDEAVHQHPYAAMSVAAGAGLMVGLLMTRHDTGGMAPRR